MRQGRSYGSNIRPVSHESMNAGRPSPLVIREVCETVTSAPGTHVRRSNDTTIAPGELGDICSTSWSAEKTWLVLDVKPTALKVLDDLQPRRHQRRRRLGRRLKNSSSASSSGSSRTRASPAGRCEHGSARRCSDPWRPCCVSQPHHCQSAVMTGGQGPLGASAGAGRSGVVKRSGRHAGDTRHTTSARACERAARTECCALVQRWAISTARGGVGNQVEGITSVGVSERLTLEEGAGTGGPGARSTGARRTRSRRTGTSTAVRRS